MTLYGLSVLLVVFGATMAALDLFLLVLTPRLLSALARMAPRQRANSILLVRSFPVGAAVLLCAGILLPAWLRHEPAQTGETASATLVAFALLAILPILQGMRRGGQMFLKTRDRILGWRGRGLNAAAVQVPFKVVEVKNEDLVLCVGGYLTPTIYASTVVMESLAPEEFSAALAHEAGHASNRDPLRLLWMGSCPDFLQLFRLDDPWGHAFSRACEFAADDGAGRGSREVALDLASALLKVARLRTFQPMDAEARADVALSPAFSSRADLEARVKALANPAFGSGSDAGWSLRPWMAVAAAVAICGFGLLSSEQIHAMTEAVGTFLAPR